MDNYNFGQSSGSHEEQLNISDMFHNFNEDDEDYEPTFDEEQHFVLTFSRHIQCDLFERMSFVSKEEAAINIKQYHIEQGIHLLLLNLSLTDM